MAYDETLNNRIIEALENYDDIEEKQMFGGTCFMHGGKMFAGVVKDELMCRIGPQAYPDALNKNGCRQMDFTGKPMMGYVYVDGSALQTRAELDYWLGLCLAFNKESKPAKKKNKAQPKS